MSKTIKVIDLLNKIANGEEVSENIKYHNRNLKETDIMICCKENIIDKLDCNSIYLNDIVEIIEEQEEIDIQSLKETEIKNDGIDYYEYITDGTLSGYVKKYNVDDVDTRIRINQLVQAVKQLDKKMREK